ncbi:hypothetical protein C8Q75DRAFT_726389 [Abortiporus biennis]|nr:hypothetical protein C8Q75DRAFT_726389 [Abortiporus biennis]
MGTNPTAAEIREVASKAVKIFSSNGLISCLCGGAGCSTYGVERIPSDVDIIVMNSQYTQEELKTLLVRSNPTFYTRAPKTIGATYRVLFYRLPPGVFRYRSCKVDILLPGIMNIPFTPSHRIVYFSDVPVLPLIPLLLLKLQAWSDHRASTRAYFQMKQYTDVRDIAKLISIAVQRREHLDNEIDWLPATFVAAARERLTRYFIIVDPDREIRRGWSIIGF